MAAHRGEHKVQDFSFLDQFLAMALAQLTARESLRDIEVHLRAQSGRLYHMGFRCQTISRNTLANANATHPWQIYADSAQHLITLARPLYAKDPLGIDLDATVHAFDATTIDLCLSVFPWAPFFTTKAAIKLHTLLDLRGAIPTVMHITDGKTHEVTVLDELLIARGAFYLPDRGYLDFGRLYALHQSHAFFVTRAKSNTQFKRRYSHAVNRATTNVFCDQTGMLTVYTSRKEYPAPLRRVVITDVDGKRLTFLTNNFVLTPELIAALYRRRWRVELFFKWIKQHLRISTSHKHTSSNLEFMLSAEDPDIFMRARSTSEVAVLTKDSRLRRACWLWALLGCGNRAGVPEGRPLTAARHALRPRLILVYVDLSASVPDTAWDRPLLRLVGELSPGDRVVLLPVGLRAPDVPLLDTVIPGTGADRLSAGFGLSTRESRRRHDDAARAFAGQLVAATRRGRTRAGAPHTAIIDAVCHAASVAQTQRDLVTVAVLLTDGIEESRFADLSHLRPTGDHAVHVARAIRRGGTCAAGAPWPRIRLVGISHPIDTPALTRWWVALLGELGYSAGAEDVSSHPLGPILGDRVARDPGPGSSRPHAGS